MGILSRLVVIQALLSHGVITHAQYMNFIYMKNVINNCKTEHEGSVIAEVGSEHCNSEGHMTDSEEAMETCEEKRKSEIQVLKDCLVSQGRAALIPWLQQGQPVDPTGPMEQVPIPRSPDGGIHPSPAQARLPTARRRWQGFPSDPPLLVGRPHLLRGGQAGSDRHEEAAILVGGVGEDQRGCLALSHGGAGHAGEETEH